MDGFGILVNRREGVQCSSGGGQASLANANKTGACGAEREDSNGRGWKFSTHMHVLRAHGTGSKTVRRRS